MPPRAPEWHTADHCSHRGRGGIPSTQTASADTLDESPRYPVRAEGRVKRCPVLTL